MPYVIGIVSVVGVWLLCMVLALKWNPVAALRELSRGDDDSVSASKFQFVLWTGVAIFSFMTIWYARARGGDYAPLDTMPANLLALMGISAGSVVASKGIVAYQVSHGSRGVSKRSKNGEKEKFEWAPWFKYLVCDEDGELALARVQMIAWTFIAISIYLIQVVHQVGNAVPTLPDVADSMLVLMGISQGAYLGKKLVSVTTPILQTIQQKEAIPGSDITLTGENFGDVQAGSIVKIVEFVRSEGDASQSQKDFYPSQVTSWSDKKIECSLPTGLEPGAHNVSVVTGGKASNSLTLTIT